MTFSVSYDPATKIVSLLVFVAAVGAALASHIPAVAFILFFVICLTYAYSPRGYACEGPSITVKRLVGDVVIPLQGLREARAATKDDFRGCLRLWGSGGLFGYFGTFRTRKLGKSTWYVTNRRNAVVVVTDSRTALFSPDDVNGFLAAIGAFAPAVSPPPAAPYDMPRFAGAGRSIGLIVGVVVGAVALAFVVFCVLYSPGPPRYTLDFRSLEIHDLFYPVTVRAADVDLDRIRVVDFAVDTDWRPTARTNGFANSHYASGWFRVANGQTVRMYRAGVTRLVLLPPKAGGAPVLLDVNDPQRFVEDLRQLWSRP